MGYGSVQPVSTFGQYPAMQGMNPYYAALQTPPPIMPQQQNMFTSAQMPQQQANGFSTSPFQQNQYHFGKDELNIGSKNLTPYETWLANNNAPSLIKDKDGKPKINQETGHLETRGFWDMGIQKWMMYIGRIMAVKEATNFLDKGISKACGADLIKTTTLAPKAGLGWFGGLFKIGTPSPNGSILDPNKLKLMYADALHYDTRLPKLFKGDLKGFFKVIGTQPPNGVLGFLKRSLDNFWLNNMMGRSYYESGVGSIAGKVLPVLFGANMLKTFGDSYGDSAKKGGNIFSNLINGFAGLGEELGKQFVSFKIADLFCAGAKFALTKLLPTVAVSNPWMMVARFGAMAVGSILSYGLINEAANRVKQTIGFGRPT